MGILSADDILRLIEENGYKIKKFGVKRIGLFGSYIKGEQSKDSDIDILVEFYDNEKTFDNYMGLKIFLEDLFNNKVDLVIAESIKDDIKPHILEDVRYAARI